MKREDLSQLKYSGVCDEQVTCPSTARHFSVGNGVRTVNQLPSSVSDCDPPPNMIRFEFNTIPLAEDLAV